MHEREGHADLLQRVYSQGEHVAHGMLLLPLLIASPLRTSRIRKVARSYPARQTALRSFMSEARYSATKSAPPALAL